MNYATGFSTLEDAWGVNPPTKRSRRSRKKLAAQTAPPAPTIVPAPLPNMADPICDLYDSKFRRRRRAREGFGAWDSQASIHHPYSMISEAAGDLGSGEGGSTHSDDEDQYDGRGADATHPPPRAPPVAPPARARSAGQARPHENHDLFMYVFSGVLLLFVLEQFIQVGLHIGVRGMDLD